MGDPHAHFLILTLTNFKLRGVPQPSASRTMNSSEQHSADFVPQPTTDGSFTFFSTQFNEAFHSHHGARQEAEGKFVQPSGLVEKTGKSTLHLLDVCYGLGYNTAAALEAVWAVNPFCHVELIGLELDLAVPKAAVSHHLLDLWSVPVQQVLSQLAREYAVKNDRLHAQLLVGDARQTLQQVRSLGFLADAVFLDPFSPPHCPQLWTVEFLKLAAQCLQPDGQLMTYSCSAAVRSALLEAGLHIGATPAVGRRSTGTIASSSNVGLPPLSPQEQEHLLTRAAVPYRDPTLSDRAEIIVQRRNLEQHISTLEPTAHWKKRWITDVTSRKFCRIEDS